MEHYASTPWYTKTANSTTTTGLPLLLNPRNPDFLPLKFGSPIEIFFLCPTFFCVTVAVWRIVKLALKNKNRIGNSFILFIDHAIYRTSDLTDCESFIDSHCHV